MAHHYSRLQLDERTRASLDGIADFLVAQDMLDAAPDFSQRIDDSFLPAGSDP